MSNFSSSLRKSGTPETTAPGKIFLTFSIEFFHHVLPVHSPAFGAILIAV
jgi:hypothetical protein